MWISRSRFCRQGIQFLLCLYGNFRQRGGTRCFRDIGILDFLLISIDPGLAKNIRDARKESMGMKFSEPDLNEVKKLSEAKRPETANTLRTCTTGCAFTWAWPVWCGKVAKGSKRANSVKMGKSRQNSQKGNGRLAGGSERSKAGGCWFGSFLMAIGVLSLWLWCLVSVSVPSLTANKALIRAY